MSEHLPVDGIKESDEQTYYKRYWLVFTALCVCTALSFVFNTALGHSHAAAVLINLVAVVKASLVIMIFMHFMTDWRKVIAIMVPVLIMCVMTVIILSIDQALTWHNHPDSAYYQYKMEP